MLRLKSEVDNALMKSRLRQAHTQLQKGGTVPTVVKPWDTLKENFGHKTIRYIKLHIIFLGSRGMRSVKFSSSANRD